MSHHPEPDNPVQPRGHIFVISAPSGAGKTTLCTILRNRFENLAYSVSYTTRLPRPGEIEGKDYFFIATDAFQLGIEQGKWAEWALVHGNYYGTSAEWIRQTLSADRDILMDIDVQGARQILEHFPTAITIFIMPPSLEELRQRIVRRGGDDPTTVDLRMKNAQSEMAQSEFYRHVVINDRLEKASQQLIDVLNAYRNPRSSEV